MIRVAWNMNKSSFQKNFEKMLRGIGLKKTEKIFSAHIDQVSLKRREKLLPV